MGAILGATPLGAIILGTATAPAVSGFNPAWCQFNVLIDATVRVVQA